MCKFLTLVKILHISKTEIKRAGLKRGQARGLPPFHLDDQRPFSILRDQKFQLSLLLFDAKPFVLQPIQTGTDMR